MTIEEVKAGNEIIGEFMGWKMFSAYEILDQWESGDRCGGKSYSDIYVLNPTELFLSQEDKSFGVNIEEDEFDGCKLYDDWAYELRFYESWDWIMPVIEKIESLDPSNRVTHTYSIEITGNGTSAYRNLWSHGENRIIARNNLKDSRLLCTWRTIIDFIKWYNNK